MSSEKTEGILLRLTDFSESSSIVAIFTRDFGRISALAKGAKRLKGPFESALDLLATCRIVFLRKSAGGLDLLTEAQLVERFRPAARDLRCLYAGYYLAELLLSLTEEYDPHPGLYDAARAALATFTEPETMQNGLLRFELICLQEIGQLPNWQECAGCGEPLTEGRTFGFWAAQGGLICPQCQREGFSQIAVTAGTAAVLRVFSADNDQAWRRLTLSAQQSREVRAVTGAAISGILGHRPKMWKYLSPG